MNRKYNIFVVRNNINCVAVSKKVYQLSLDQHQSLKDEIKGFSPNNNLAFSERVACHEQGKGKEGAETEPVGISKDFDFQILVIDVMFKLIIQVASSTTATNLTYMLQLRNWSNTIF